MGTGPAQLAEAIPYSFTVFILYIVYTAFADITCPFASTQFIICIILSLSLQYVCTDGIDFDGTVVILPVWQGFLHFSTAGIAGLMTQVCTDMDCNLGFLSRMFSWHSMPSGFITMFIL